MAFALSRCVGLVTPDLGVAADYYQEHFDMNLVEGGATELKAGPLRLFLDPGQPRPLVFELVTDDLLDARQHARQFGFEELMWRGIGQPCLVRDPFGIVFNIHEDRSAFLPMNLNPPDPGFVKPCLGAITPNPMEAAYFYAEVLESNASRIPDTSYVVDSGALRLRFKIGPRTTPVVWLRSTAPVERLLQSGCSFSQHDLLTDPFGVVWTVEAQSTAKRAVCSPL